MQNPHIFTGDTTRLHAVFDKALQGKPISIVFLGASITMGFRIEKQHQFTTAVQQYFQNEFHNEQVSCHNLSAAGLSSLHGLHLAYSELETYSPDFICLDYSVNDQKNMVCREAFEGLLVKCLSLPTVPALISFFVKKEIGYTCAPQMAAVCEYYGIPYVNIGSWLEADIRRGVMRWRDFSYDGCHPGPVGHGYIGGCLLHLLDTVRRTSPDSLYLTDSDRLLSDTSIPGQGFYKNELAFLHFISPDWENTSECHPAPFVLDAEFHTLFIGYFVDTTEDYGKAVLSVDENVIRCLDAYRVHEWDHPEYEIVYLAGEKKSHHLTLEMREGETDKRFHLLCLGYI